MTPLVQNQVMPIVSFSLSFVFPHIWRARPYLNSTIVPLRDIEVNLAILVITETRSTQTRNMVGEMEVAAGNKLWSTRGEGRSGRRAERTRRRMGWEEG